MTIQKKNKHLASEKGVVTVYMALMVVLVMVGSTLILTDVISRQFRSAADVELTERAFYGASTGFERAAYQIKTRKIGTDIVEGEIGEISGNMLIQYDDLSIVVDRNAFFTVVGNQKEVHAICSEGVIIDRGYVARSLTFGEDCQPWIDGER